MARKDQKDVVFYLVIGLLLSLGLVIYGYIFESRDKQDDNFLTAKNVQVFVQPDDSRSPILEEIENAKSSIILQVYTMSDSEIIQSLIDARKRGINVRVMLEENPFSGYSANKEVKDELSRNNIDTKWSNRVYEFTHSKFFVIDNKKGIIMTMNLSQSSFTKNREFGVITEDPIIVTELSKIFQADWERKPYKPGTSPLVVSPENSRVKLLQLINSAKQEIILYAQEMEDKEIRDALIKARNNSVKVYIIFADPESIEGNQDAFDTLKSHNIETRILLSPYVHAKAIVVDKKVGYIGSINFSENSLDKNREVGILISDEKALSLVRSVFFEDFEIAYLGFKPNFVILANAIP